MDPAAHVIEEENRRLRRTMRDMVALSTLPAIWTGLSLEAIAGSLADVLFHTLSLDLISIRLAASVGDSAPEVIRTQQGLDAAEKEALNEAIATILQDKSRKPLATIANPFGEGSLRIAVTPFGVGDDYGVLLAGSRSADFPTEQDRLLLGIGANQAAIVMQRRRAELALQQREQELQLVTDHAPVFLAHCDNQGRFKFVNKGYAARFGLIPQDVIGKHLKDVVGEQAYEIFRPYLDAVLAGQPVEFEVEVPYSQIGARTMHCTYAPEFDAAGRVTGLVAVIADVTDRKQAETALQQSEQRFAEFMQHLPGLAWIKDGEGRYVYANAAAERAFRVSRAALYGKTDEEVFPPDTAAQFRRNDLLAMSSRSGVQLVEALAAADGEVRYSLVNKFPLHDSGPSKLVGGMAIDITEQRRAEEEIRHREERFRSLMEQAPYSIQLFSPDGRTIRVNQA